MIIEGWMAVAIVGGCAGSLGVVKGSSGRRVERVGAWCCGTLLGDRSG
jgi:hypothetical protein